MDPPEGAGQSVALYFQIVAGLEVEPELVGGTEELGQPQGRVSRDGPLPVDDLVDTPGRNFGLLGQGID